MRGTSRFLLHLTTVTGVGIGAWFAGRYSKDGRFYSDSDAVAFKPGLPIFGTVSAAVPIAPSENSSDMGSKLSAPASRISQVYMSDEETNSSCESKPQIFDDNSFVSIQNTPVHPSPKNSVIDVICSVCKEKIDPDSANYTTARQDLPTFLKSTLTGVQILAEFEKTGHISDRAQSDLAHLLIDREVLWILREKNISVRNPIQKLSVPTEILMTLANEIHEYFNLKTTIFYSAARTSEGTSHPAFGKLLARVNTVRKDLKAVGLFEVRHKKTAPTDNSTKIPTSKADINFLKSVTKPWKEVKEIWENTLHFRQAKEPCGNWQFNTFPCLLEANGRDLVDFDFSKKYPDSLIDANEIWDSMKNSFQLYLLSRNFIDDESRELSQLLADSSISASGKDVICLKLLPTSLKVKDARVPFSALNEFARKKAKIESAETKAIREKERELLILHVEIMKFGFPGLDHVRSFDDYVLSYDRRNRVAHWVFEHLTKNSLKYNDKIDRSKCDFKPDLSIHPYFRSDNTDYKRSGYDRGHMAAAGNHRLEQKHVEQTFFLSNMAPQVGEGFNRHSWNRLEKHVRKLTNIYKDVYVCTGPLYLPQVEADGKKYVRYEVIGNNHVAVPTHFYKIVVGETHDSKFEMEAFVMPNKPINDKAPLTAFQVPPESIERAAGLLFFDKLSRERLQKINGKPV